jgi:hypothetical protein
MKDMKDMLKDIESGAAEARVRRKLGLVNWTKENAIAACVEVSRDPSATAAERKDARNMILLLVGAIDGFTDRDGEENMRPEVFVQLWPESPSAPDVRASITARRAIDRAAGRARK